MRHVNLIVAATALSLVTAACAVTAAEASDEGVASASTAEAVDPTYVVVDTGQSECYDDATAIPCPDEADAWYGQDAGHEGPQPSYVDNRDGTVTDLNTGLMWQQDPGEKMTYADAVAGADEFDLAGYDDWRLPTIDELYSLILFSGTDPSNCSDASGCGNVPFIDTDYFVFSYGDPAAGERVIDSQYVSSTEYVSTTMGGDPTVFGVNFADGRIKGYPISDPQGGEKEFFVLYVRGNADYGVNDFTDNGDATVSDGATGLLWQQDDSGEGMGWPEALEYCESLEAGGYDDWRLPNAKELQSIVDYTRSPSTTDSAAIDPTFDATRMTDEGGGTDYGFYWTSTTHATLQSGGNAVYIAFGEALGWMSGPQGGTTLLDVHGAGAQRSDPKTGDAGDYPYGRGPQGDVVRIENLVRCVRDDARDEQSDGVACDGATATIVGTDGDDVLVGTEGDDVVWAGGGDDLVVGRGGDDTICLGEGDDRGWGGGGDDVVWGGPGDDVVRGLSGADRLYGGDGEDLLTGGGLADLIEGGASDDVLRGGSGADTLDGGTGWDELYGGAGVDSCAGEVLQWC
jgi:Ca2+-binding RTX toxin-like protein